jgi:hypothetical protein
MHARLRPFLHRFVYRVFCLRLRIDTPRALQTHNSWLFGVERARPVSFWSADHGDNDGSDLYEWIKLKLSQSSLVFEVGAVTLQCFPRVFGYVFNPVSFWFVYDKQGQLRVLLAEVNNTFGQKHQYVLNAQTLSPIDEEAELECMKVFHVSPFCDVVGRYRFKYSHRSGHQRVSINYHDTSEHLAPLLRTAIVTQAEPLTTRRLFSSVLSMPMMTVGVMLRIHIQAFKLWRKGARYHAVPALPEHELTTDKKVEQ